MIANSSLPHNHNRNLNLNPPPDPRRRNPIERLPSSIREQVNQLIDDAKPFPEILQWLATSGHPAITEADLTAYAEGPFQRWVRDHERMDRFAAQQDIASDLTKGENLHNFNTATVTIAQLNLFEVLNRFDITTLTKRIEEKPELWFQLISAFCSFSRLQLARDKFEWQKKQAEARQRAREEKQRARTPIVITAATVHSIQSLLQPSPAPEPIALDQPVVVESPVRETAAVMDFTMSRRLRHAPPCLTVRRSAPVSARNTRINQPPVSTSGRLSAIQSAVTAFEPEPLAELLISSPS